MDHPSDLSSLEEAFCFIPLCCFFLSEDSSLGVSVQWFLEATRNCGSLALVIAYDVFISPMDFADSISWIHAKASIGRQALEDTSHLKLIRQILKLLNSR